MMPSYVSVLVLDTSGNVLAVEQDYNDEKGTSATGTVKFYTNTENLRGAPAGIAMFVNPTK